MSDWDDKNTWEIVCELAQLTKHDDDIQRFKDEIKKLKAANIKLSNQVSFLKATKKDKMLRNAWNEFCVLYKLRTGKNV